MPDPLPLPEVPAPVRYFKNPVALSRWDKNRPMLLRRKPSARMECVTRWNRALGRVIQRMQGPDAADISSLSTDAPLEIPSVCRTTASLERPKRGLNWFYIIRHLGGTEFLGTCS